MWLMFVALVMFILDSAFQAKRTSIKIRERSLSVAIIFVCLSSALPSLYHYHSLHVYLPD